MSDSHNERRRFSRVLFDARVELAQYDYHWHATLLDISLKGVLLQDTLPKNISADKPILVKIILADNTSIAMSVIVTHQNNNQVGLKCMAIDIDSVCHLRRLIELNLGSAEAAEREISELMSDL